MKLIPKKQQGGSFTSFFASYTPFIPQGQAAPQQASGRSSGNQGTKPELTRKDALSLLNKVDALPNELAALTKSVQDMYDMASINGETDPTMIGQMYTS